MSTSISRRDALKLGGIVAAGSAAAAMIGCSPSNGQSAPASGDTANVGVNSIAGHTREGIPSFLQAPEPITDITETGFLLHHRVTDNGTLAGLTVTLTSDTGEERSTFLVTDGESDFPWSADGLTEGVWTISVTATDAAGNGSRYTFDWKYTAGEARPGLTVARLGTP